MLSDRAPNDGLSRSTISRQNDGDDDNDGLDDHQAIERLQHVHAVLSSDDAIRRWISSYESEKQRFASFAVFAELKLDEIQGSARTRPNAVEVAACVASLRKVPGIVGCYTSLLEKLASGLESAIYVPDDSRTATAPGQQQQSTDCDAVPMPTLVQTYYERKTYFAHVQSLQAELLASRSLSDARVLASLTVDEVVRVLVQVPMPQFERAFEALALGPSSSSRFERLYEAAHATHTAMAQALHVHKRIHDEEDDAYPFFVPLATSAQLCRAIAHSASSFSASGKEMVLCAILEFVDVESFRDVFKRFDAHAKALFLHHVSVLESSETLHAIVAQLPSAGEMLFRFYLVSCGAQGDPTSATKHVFYHKLLSPDVEYFFLCDLATYLNDEQFLLLSKEFEKCVLERKRRRRATRRNGSLDSSGLGGDMDDLDDESDDDDGDGSDARAGGRSIKSSIENFQLLIWNFLHHHRLTSAQVLSIVATVMLPSLEPKELAALMDHALEAFALDGRWLQLLRIVDEIEAEPGASGVTSVASTASAARRPSDNNVVDSTAENVRATRLKLLKKLFAMLSRDERESWLDKVNAKYTTEAMKKRLQSLKTDAAAAASKTLFVTAAPVPEPAALSLDDPKPHVATMKIELKMHWIECLLDAIAANKESSARMAMLRQVLQPFLEGRALGGCTGTLPTKLNIVVVEKSITQLLGQLTPAERAKVLAKLAPPPPPVVVEERPMLDRSTSPIPELRDDVVAPSAPLPVLPTTNPDILSAFQSLVACKSEARVIQILRNGLIQDDDTTNDKTHASDDVPAPMPKLPSQHSGLSNDLKRKLSAVVAVAEPMEWQEYVKLGSVDVGCQTIASDLEAPVMPVLDIPAPLVVATDKALSRSSVLPNRLAPLTLNALLGKASNVASPRKKDAKYQKINSAAVPRSIGGLITSWRMNADQLTQFAKKSLSVVLKTIADAYSEMLTAGRRKTAMPNAPARGRELTLAQVVYQQFLHSYGLPGIADMHLLAFACAIELYRAQHVRVEYFARFCFDEVSKTELANYLEFLECIVCDDVNVTAAAAASASSGSSTGRSAAMTTQHAPAKRSRFVPRIVVPDKEHWSISVEKAQEAAHLCFRAMRKHSVLAFCDRLVAIAAMGTSSAGAESLGPQTTAAAVPAPTPSASELTINVDHLLQLVAYEWRDEQLRRDTYLLDAFRAGDVNGDGQLTSAEFSQIVLSIDRTRDLGDILLMFSETLRRTACDAIDTQVFLQVAKEYELDRAVWHEDGDLRNIVNGISDLETTWRHARAFFLGTLEALSRDLVPHHFLRVCEGAGCGCLKCILDGYIGFQKMRRDFATATQQQQREDASGGSSGMAVGVASRSAFAVSESLVWARYWHLMRQLFEAASESDGVLTPWEGSATIRVEPAPAMPLRFVAHRRNALPNLLFPDTLRVSAVMRAVHDPEVFDAATITEQFADLLQRMTFKKPETT